MVFCYIMSLLLFTEYIKAVTLSLESDTEMLPSLCLIQFSILKRVHLFPPNMPKLHSTQRGSFFSSWYSVHAFHVFCTINYTVVAITLFWSSSAARKPYKTNHDNINHKHKIKNGVVQSFYNTEMVTEEEFYISLTINLHII